MEILQCTGELCDPEPDLFLGDVTTALEMDYKHMSASARRSPESMHTAQVPS